MDNFISILMIKINSFYITSQSYDPEFFLNHFEEFHHIFILN